MTRTCQTGDGARGGGHIQKRQIAWAKVRRHENAPSSLPYLSQVIWCPLGGDFGLCDRGEGSSSHVPCPCLTLSSQEELQASSLLTPLHLLSLHYPLVRGPCSIFSLGSRCRDKPLTPGPWWHLPERTPRSYQIFEFTSNGSSHSEQARAPVHPRILPIAQREGQGEERWGWACPLPQKSWAHMLMASLTVMPAPAPSPARLCCLPPMFTSSGGLLPLPRPGCGPVGWGN